MNKIIIEIEKKVQQKEAIKQQINQLEKLKISGYINFEELEAIDIEIEKLKQNLDIKEKKSFDEIEKFLDKFDLDPVKVKNAKFDYLYPNMIVENEITMIAAKPESGKSLTAIGIANYVAKNGKRIVYFDGDNGITTIKEREIDSVKIKFGKKFRYFHESNAKKSEMLSIVSTLYETDLSNTFIVFDSIKNFVKGDRDKNRDVSETMNMLKSLRRQGATVLFLHHTNKPQKDLAELTYAGSSAWEEDTSNAFILKKNDFRRTFIFTPIKKRVGELTEIAFTYNQDTHTINKVDLSWAKETEEHEEIKAEIIDFLKNQNEKPTYSQIIKHLIDQGYVNKDKNNTVVQTGKDKLWRATKIPEKNNRDVYELIKEPKVEIVYKNNSRIGQISPFSSDKSKFRGIEEREYLSDRSFSYSDKSYNNIDIPII
ncbi:MAG: AAA family ATPase [Sulfurospirillaceae bacterium]|nr:AAA family ATPase [Sulfurospirillaceae bacterium]